MRRFAPVRQALGLHWFHFGQPLLPPIIDAIPPAPDNQQILVYLPFEQTEAIAALLSRFNQQRFVCFHPAIRSASQWRNIAFEPQAREGSSRCWPAVAGSSPTVASSSPRRRSPWQEAAGQAAGGQFEQLTNSKTLELMGLARLMDALDANAVRAWLDAAAPGQIIYPDVASELAGWLADGAQESVPALSPAVGSHLVPGRGVRSAERTGGAAR